MGIEEYYQDGELKGVNIHEGEGYTEIHENDGEESGKVIHMTEKENLMEEYGRLAIELGNANDSEKLDIEEKMKKIEKELGLKEAA